MHAFIYQHEMLIRLGFFFGVLLIIALWEFFWPRRQLSFSRSKRWPSNLGIVAVDSVILRLIMPILAIGIALVAQQNQWGLFNIIRFPYWLAVLVSVIILDFVIYLQHVMFHAIPLFWRIHRMHHTDLDIDVTTGLRFHPIEIILSMLIKISAVILLGAPAISVLIFEVLLNATSMFNHGNIYLPKYADKIIRSLIVTPDMHRVHHSIIRHETHSNFGFNLSIWDRALMTYIAQPKEGHHDMTIGLEIFRDPKNLRLDKLLLIPFIKTK
jgi:sterol desaturase/sphingolipid hydroxylase (fatty acid hydroxylase superfamily)